MWQCTIMVALLQPAPETYNLFDDVMLLDVGKSSCSNAHAPIWSIRYSNYGCRAGVVYQADALNDVVHAIFSHTPVLPESPAVKSNEVKSNELQARLRALRQAWHATQR